MNRSQKKFHVLIFSSFIFLLHLPFVFAKSVVPDNPKIAKPITTSDLVPSSSTVDANLYENLHLNDLGLSEEAYNYGIRGYEYLRSQGKLNNDEILSIVDFSLPSSAKRLFVLDLKNDKILYNTYVAHGRNSGKEYARKFSNRPSSFKSSLGFYITQGTYIGEHGFSLRLEGEEEGINDNALSRAIVIHSADYVNKKLIQSQGYIGRSLGCPALPRQVYKPIIQKIKDGSCLFMFSPNSNYVSRSKLLQLAS